MSVLEETQKETRQTMINLILGGFSLVAALAWNDAIQTFFNTFFPKESGVLGKFIYAALITLLVVTLSLQLKKFFSTNEESTNQKKSQQ